MVVIIILCIKKQNGYQQVNNEGDTLAIEIPVSDSLRTQTDPLKQYLMPYHLPNTLRLHKVGSDCELRQYLTKTLRAEFKRGHTYYEFTNEVENILEGKEVLLQDRKKPKKWFQLAQSKEVAAGDIKLYGEGISRSTFGKQYTVFIQSFGSGARHIPRGTYILYNHNDQVTCN